MLGVLTILATLGSVFLLSANLVICSGLDVSISKGMIESVGEKSPDDSGFENSVQPRLGDEFDLEACQQECRSKYGMDPYRSHGGDTSWWRLYAICIQDCNSRFWKEYDKRIQKLKDLKLD